MVDLGQDKNTGDFTFINTNGMSVVDYLLLNNNDICIINEFEILPMNDFSDHCALYFCIERIKPPFESRDNIPADDQFIAWDDSRADIFRRLLLDDSDTLLRLTDDVNNNSIDQTVELFTTYIQQHAFNVFGKRKKPAMNSSPSLKRNKWFNKECFDAKKEFHKTRNMFLRNKSNENKLNFLIKKREYNKIKKKRKKQYKRKEGEKVSKLAKKDPKTFWKNIKSQYKTSNGNTEIPITDMYTHFNDLYGAEAQNQQRDAGFISDQYDDYLDAPFTEDEIKSAVFAQKNSKSPGIDHLTAEVFKHSFDIISPFLCKFYNKIFSEASYPQSWGEGIIIPLFKGGNHEPKNFRGITLNNIISKIYSKLLVTRLTKWADMHDKIIDNQFGFQKGKSTIDCIFLLHSIICKTLSERKKLYVAFLDWEKMFDKIDRLYLWQKLLNENISTKFVNALKLMYSVVKSFIQFNQARSDYIISNIGVKQGDPASSILCLFFLNDLLNSINSNINGIIQIENLKLFLIFFADDAILFSQDPTSLQSMLDDIENYCNTWNLKINVNKTKIMIFENGRHTSHDFFLYNSRIDIVTSFKYLGVHLFKNGNWNRTQKRIAQHASVALHNVFIACNQLDLPVSQKNKLFDSLVAPTLNYAAEVWGYSKGPDIENVHTKFCRKLLKVKRSTNANALYGELGRIPMSVNRKIIMIRYWIKLLNSNEDSLIYKVYSTIKNDAENGQNYNKNNWAYHIKCILDECGLSFIWQTQFTMQINFNIIKQRILDIYSQQWYSEINNSRRLETYCLFKHSLNFEEYLDFITEPKYRIALTRFRTSSHNLAIETGRYNGIPRENRICNNCSSRMIENEYHILLTCNKYSDLRSKYLKKYYYSWPTLQKFVNLLSIKNKNVIRNLSKYIFHANNQRR